MLIGAVHDFSTLVASVRHQGRSIAGVVRAHFGPQAWIAILAFIWLALVYVMVAFVDVTATTFVAGDRSLVETGAGLGIGFDDRAYEAAGAKIARNAEEVFAKAEMVVKVKEPQPQEWKQLKEGQILFTYLHLAPDPEQTRGLMDSGVTAIAYETVTNHRGGLPLLAPMSEVAGRM